MAHQKIVMSGTLGTPAIEEWSVSFCFAGAASVGPDTPSELSAWAVTVANAWTALPTTHTLKQWLTSSAAVTQVDAYHYDTFNAPASAVGTASVLSGAGNGTIGNPFQCARAISLRTDTAGRRARGRFYWPDLSSTPQATGKVNTSSTSVTAIRDWLELVEASAGQTSDYRLVVVSQAGSLVTSVTSIAVGDVLDTQRRRRNRLPEAYTNAPYPA